jgi:hypothetical protein
MEFHPLAEAIPSRREAGPPRSRGNGKTATIAIFTAMASLARKPRNSRKEA